MRPLRYVGEPFPKPEYEWRTTSVNEHIGISNAADWHATMAIKAYRKRQYNDYIRHIRIADELRKGLL